MNKKGSIILITLLLVGSGIAYATMNGVSETEGRIPIEFYSGHTHDVDGATIGAPSHSGGTNSAGCHNASVPYHCH
jgi:hypothetical protein